MPALQAGTRHTPARVAILINNTYVADARAWKTAESLGKAGYHVTVIARWGPGLATTEKLIYHTVTRIRQPQPLSWLPAPSLPETGDDPHGRTGGLRRRVRDTVGRAIQALRYLRMSRAWSKVIAEQVDGFDVWQAESVITLSLAVSLRSHFGGMVVYDANDIDSEAGRMARLPGPWKQLLRRHEKRLARAADAVVTVSDPYAQSTCSACSAARSMRSCATRPSSMTSRLRSRPTTSPAATASTSGSACPPAIGSCSTSARS